MLRKLRIFFAIVMIAGITALMLDFSRTLAPWLGWMPKIQLLPALLALNLAVVAELLIATLVFGRVYCSVVCPLGVMQDVFTWLSMRPRRRRYRLGYTKANTAARIIILALFAVLLLAGLTWAAALIAPYSAYGRIVRELVDPVYIGANNLLASWAERADSYAFYSVAQRPVVWVPLLTAVVTMVALAITAWRSGRAYCNTVCPVGTVLGYLSRYSLLAPVIDTSKCNNCGLCARHCKARCIDSKAHAIDYTRCVACMDCIDTCRHGAISYTRRAKAEAPAHAEETPADTSRRTFMATAAIAATAAASAASHKTVDGGLAEVLDKKAPVRTTPVLPPGAVSLRHFARHCTSCQLCVGACPSHVLRPSTDLSRLMQPESGFETGYCRTECTRCSDACPTGAILPVSREEKSSLKRGYAVWIKENCVVLTDDEACGNCARHCPAGAIAMVHTDAGDPTSPLIPAVDTERCIGCGACENLCPARPFSAIYVEGVDKQRTI